MTDPLALATSKAIDQFDRTIAACDAVLKDIQAIKETEEEALKKLREAVERMKEETV